MKEFVLVKFEGRGRHGAEGWYVCKKETHSDIEKYISECVRFPEQAEYQGDSCAFQFDTKEDYFKCFKVTPITEHQYDAISEVFGRKGTEWVQYGYLPHIQDFGSPLIDDWIANGKQ